MWTMNAGTEMMLRNLFKLLPFDGEQVINEIKAMTALFLDGRNHALQANERLARIEAKLGIENSPPVNPTLVITHDATFIHPDGALADGGRGDGGAR